MCIRDRYDFRFLASAVPEREMAGVMHAINRNSNIDIQSVNCPLIPKAFHTSCLPPKCALRVHGLRFYEIRIFWTYSWNSDQNSSRFSMKMTNLPVIFAKIRWKFPKICDDFLLKFCNPSGAKVHKSCRSRKILKNDYLVAKFGVDTAANEPL